MRRSARQVWPAARIPVEPTKLSPGYRSRNRPGPSPQIVTFTLPLGFALPQDSSTFIPQRSRDVKCQSADHRIRTRQHPKGCERSSSLKKRARGLRGR